MTEPDPLAIPAVLFDLADVLPQFTGADLESQLQTYDVFLERLPAFARPAIVALLRSAAANTPDPTSRARVEAAAQSIAEGGRAAEPYDHRRAMQEYRTQHAANYAPKPAENGSIVDLQTYESATCRPGVHKDPSLPKRNLGEVERWIDADGRVVAWMIVRYFKGEEDYDYFVAT